jgi:phospholipid/cholesterol/gamma-HCH transport system ATP-binding protein
VSLRRIEGLLMEVNRRLGMTLIVVSHDVPSTMRMADHAILLTEDGCTEGTPRQLHDSSDPDVASFFNGSAPQEQTP